MLGRELTAALGQRLDGPGRQRVIGWDLPDLDIRKGEAVLKRLRRQRPSVVVNAAARTDVDECEGHAEEAMSVNAQAPGHVARACTEIEALCVHIGTDFIFDGRSDRPYRPDDEANPLSVYGRSKWEGERAVRSSGCDHLVIRTSWLFAPHGRHFVGAILNRGRAGKPLRVVDDQVGRPTLASDLAEAVIRLLDAGARQTVHFANAGQCSWFEFACEIVRQAGLDVPVRAIHSEELGQPARRPPYSVLDTDGYTRLTGHEPASWQDALRRYFAVCEARASSGADAGVRPATTGGA
jgi:dTDP-4-dehydrorhamnose reductase